MYTQNTSVIFVQRTHLDQENKCVTSRMGITVYFFLSFFNLMWWWVCETLQCLLDQYFITLSRYMMMRMRRYDDDDDDVDHAHQALIYIFFLEFLCYPVCVQFFFEFSLYSIECLSARTCFCNCYDFQWIEGTINIHKIYKQFLFPINKSERQ